MRLVAAPATKPTTNFGWTYLHLPMTIGIAATGAAVLNVVEHVGAHLHAEVRWLLVGAIALISIALLMQTIQIRKSRLQIYRRGNRITLISAIVVILVGFSNLSAILLLIVLNLLMFAPIFYGIKAWIQILAAEEETPRNN